MAHAYLTGTGPRTNPPSCPAPQRIMTLVMQNKPNLLDTQMNVSSALTKHYENNRLPTRPKNKPNQTQSKSRPHPPTKPKSPALPALPAAERSEIPPLSVVPIYREPVGDLSGAPPGLLPFPFFSFALHEIHFSLLSEAKSRRAGARDTLHDTRLKIDTIIAGC